MKLHAKSRWLCVIGIFVFMAAAALIAGRFMPVDYSKEDEPFRSMAMPPKDVFGTIWMDGGSVSIRITDRNGRIHEFILPYDHTDPWVPYPKAYSGVFDMNGYLGKGTPIWDAERARFLAIRLLENHADRNREEIRITLSYLKRGGRYDVFSLPDKLNASFRDWAAGP